jgi:hypothetical protein
MVDWGIKRSSVVSGRHTLSCAGHSAGEHFGAALKFAGFSGGTQITPASSSLPDIPASRLSGIVGCPAEPFAISPLPVSLLPLAASSGEPPLLGAPSAVPSVELIPADGSVSFDASTPVWSG